MGVLKFTGVNSDERSKKKLKKLRKMMMKDKLLDQAGMDITMDAVHCLNWNLAELYP